MVVLATLLGGCGGGEAASVPAEESSQSPAFLLLQEDDLPPGSVQAEALPEPCSPVYVLEEQNAEVAASPLYSLRSNYMGEAVGIAPSAKKAASALEELQGPERLSCIRSAIESFDPSEEVAVTVEDPKPVAEGEEGTMVRLLEGDTRSQPVDSTTIVSFRSGRCVATLLFLLKGEDTGRAFLDNLVGRAYDSLADADATCR